MVFTIYKPEFMYLKIKGKELDLNLHCNIQKININYFIDSFT